MKKKTRKRKPRRQTRRSNGLPVQSLVPSRTARFFWRDGTLTGVDHETGRRETFNSPAPVVAFDCAAGGVDRETLVSRLREHVDDRRASTVVDELVEGGFLRPTDETSPYENWFDYGWQWGLYLHLALRRLPSTAPSTFDTTHDTGVDGPAVSLPEDPPRPDGTVHDVFHRRRTHRNFGGEPVDPETLSAVFEYGVPADEPTRPRVELYPVVARAEGISPGSYHYDRGDHQFERITDHESATAVDDRLVEVTHNQEYCRGGAVTVLFSVPMPTELRDQTDARLLRASYLATAAVCHRLTLVATAAGLRAFQSPALRDGLVDDLAGLDTPEESVTYLLTLGS